MLSELFPPKTLMRTKPLYCSATCASTLKKLHRAGSLWKVVSIDTFQIAHSVGCSRSWEADVFSQPG